MIITTETELMKNQKHADVMAPELAFEALQTTEGGSILFSIGTDNIFYATREIIASNTGWTRLDLSSILSANHGGAPITVKSFKISQNPVNLAMDIALILKAGDQDFLYLALNFNPNLTDWLSGIPWMGFPFDASSGTTQDHLTIDNVYVMNIPSPQGAFSVSPTIFVDIERTPDDHFSLLDRYYILTDTSPHWIRQRLPIDLQSGAVFNCLGHRSKDPLPGIYTFGTIGNQQELIYTPQYNYFNPKLPPIAARLQLPALSTSIASAMNAARDSNLYVASSDGIYLFKPDNQRDKAVPILVIPASTIAGRNILAGVKALNAFTTDTTSVLWGMSAQGDLFHMSCDAGSESDPTRWSAPVPLISNIEQYAFYLNVQASNNIIFAHTSGQQLLQFTQDPSTSIWSQRSLLLPPTDVNDIIEYNSFTTHIKVMNDNNVGLANVNVALTSTTDVTVYVDNVYHTLGPNFPVGVVTDVTGAITIVQETQSLAAVCIQLAIPGVTDRISIDPLSKAMQKLSAVNSGDDLGNVEITTSKGDKRPLVSSDVSSGAKDSVAKSLTNFLNVKNTLPADGSPKKATSLQNGVQTEASVIPKSWGLMLTDPNLQYFEGEDAHRKLAIPKLNPPNKLRGTNGTSSGGLSNSTPNTEFGIFDSIEIAAGDLFHWIKDIWSDVESVLVQEAMGFYYFCAKIGDKIYSAILDCVSAVVNGVEFVFNQIKVFFEDLIAWLGFLFDWDDILRTHSVMKNILKQTAKNALESVGSLESTINDAFVTLEEHINSFAGITDSGINVGTQQRAGAAVPSQHSPQSNWATYHTKNGISVSETSFSEKLANDSSPLDKILADLEAIVQDEGEYIVTTIQQIKEQVADKFSDLTPVQVIKRLFGILSDLILKSARNVIVKTIDIISIIADGLLDLLDAPLDIPILSWIYKLITGNQLSFLGLICLIGAIPATLIFKLVANRAPYPDDSATNALIDAQDFSTLRNLLSGPEVSNVDKEQSSSSIAQSSLTDQINKIQTVGAADLTPLDIASITLNFGALIGAPCVAIASSLKYAVQAPAIPGRPLRYLSAAAYLLYCGPNFSGAFSDAGSWTTVLNDAMTGISILKTFADNTEYLSNNISWTGYGSPITESLINAVWLVPACGAFAEKPSLKNSDIVSFVSNLAFDVGGCITFLTSDKIVTNKVYATGFFGVTMVFTLCYGILCVGTGGLLIDSQ